jgi:putative salt-induced outer membrane protein YdiY
LRLIHWPALVAALLIFADASPAQTLPIVTTNYIIVTNMVLVTNAATTTNLSTTAAAVEKSKSDLPELGWVPPDDEFDWIQLKSGEWLKGTLTGMQNRVLEFRSEELNDLTFDWKDIRQVRSKRTFNLLSVNGNLASGPVSITPDTVTVNGPVTLTYPRDSLHSLTPGGEKERNLWSGKLSLGLTLRAGNSSQTEYNAQARLRRRTPGTRLSLDYIGFISSLEGAQTANDHRVNAEFDVWLSRRLFLVLPGLEYYKDRFQNIDYRLTGGVGVGYDLIANRDMEWNVTAGPAYQKIVYYSVEPGEDDSKTTGALTFGTRYDWTIRKGTDLIVEYRGQFTSKDVGETTHHTVATLSLDITKQIDLDVTFTWDRISDPKAGANGVVPKPDDFRLVVGFGVNY